VDALLSLIFGATAYTFSLILAVFLVGLGIGSSVGAALAKNATNPREALGWCQVALCAALAWAATPRARRCRTGRSIRRSPPAWSSLPARSRARLLGDAAGRDPVGRELSARAGLGGRARAGLGALVGGVYAANTVGAIVGALVTALGMVGVVGSQITQQVLIGIAALSGLLLLGSAPGDARGFRASLPALVRVIVVAAAAGLFARVVPPLPGLLVAYGRYAATWVGQNEIIYVGEGVTASVAVSRTPSGTLNYHNAGKVQASSEPQDMRLQRMLGHITTLVPKNPRKVLVIGCGAGVTAGAVSVDPMVKDQTIAEIEPLVPRVVSTYFAAHNFNVVANPKVKVHLDDARHYLLTTDEKFDAITSDPLDPWVKGAATLYTREFFDVVKSHLNPGGVVTLFVQLYESTEAAAKSEVATFLEAFPNGAGVRQHGQRTGLRPGALRSAREQPDRRGCRAGAAGRSGQCAHRAVAARDRHQLGRRAVRHLCRPSHRHGQWLRDAQINTDSNLKLQYLAGSG
jgi:spermidine synthase